MSGYVRLLWNIVSITRIFRCSTARCVPCARSSATDQERDEKLEDFNVMKHTQRGGILNRIVLILILIFLFFFLVLPIIIWMIPPVIFFFGGLL